MRIEENHKIIWNGKEEWIKVKGQGKDNKRVGKRKEGERERGRVGKGRGEN
jgi:hypothetical protein